MKIQLSIAVALLACVPSEAFSQTSVALWGGGNVVSGSHSAAGGANNYTGPSGFASVAFGDGCQTLSPVSVALGYQSVVLATAHGGFAQGCQNRVSGHWSAAIGHKSEANGWGSYAQGHLSKANGTTSLAIGWIATANGYNSRSLGENSTSNGDYSTAIGSGAISQAFHSVALGPFPVAQGNATAWVSTDPVLTIANGETATIRSNAITTLKNGQTTLTNKEWKANPAVAPTIANSQGQALVVEGHTLLKGSTTLGGTVIISVPQGDISMGSYQ